MKILNIFKVTVTMKIILKVETVLTNSSMFELSKLYLSCSGPTNWATMFFGLLCFLTKSLLRNMIF